jgi:hypothetical protein
VRLSPEIDIIAGADVVYSTEGRVATPQWPGARDPAGVEEQGTLTGVLQEPGRPHRLLGKSRREHRVTNSRPTAGAPGGRGSEPRVRPGYRQAKATKRGGTGDGESEHLRCTDDAGEPTRGTPPREGGAGL